MAQGSPIEGGCRPIGYRKILAVVFSWAAERVCDTWCEFDKLLQVQSLGTLRETSRLGGLRRSHGERSLFDLMRAYKANKNDDTWHDTTQHLPGCIPIHRAEHP